MALTANELILKEPTIQYGSWASPASIVPGTDPSASFTATDDCGYIRMGTIRTGISREQVEYLSGTPHEIVAKDLLRKNVVLEFTINQFNPTYLAIFQRALTESGSYNLVHYGLDEPTETRYGYLMSGELRDGTLVYWGIYEGGIASEEVGPEFPGTDYVDLPVQVQAFRHTDFSNTSTNNQKCYGLYWEVSSS